MLDGSERERGGGVPGDSPMNDVAPTLLLVCVLTVLCAFCSRQ